MTEHDTHRNFNLQFQPVIMVVKNTREMKTGCQSCCRCSYQRLAAAGPSAIYYSNQVYWKGIEFMCVVSRVKQFSCCVSLFCPLRRSGKHMYQLFGH